MYTLISETMFCDFEPDASVREKYLKRWLFSLEQLSRLNIPENTTCYHALYISTDKEKETRAVRDLIDSFPLEIQNRFKVVAYDHPAEGYGNEGATHPDVLKNPNKHAPRRDMLFQRFIDTGVPIESEYIIRVALDDDDIWLPWQVEEIIRAAAETYDSREIVAVGLQRNIFGYFADGFAEIADTTRYLSGNKFYISPRTKFDRLSKVSPWSLPEVFSDEIRERFGNLGIAFREISNNKPGWIYGRWGSNLTVQNKSVYYQNDSIRVDANTPQELVDNLIREINGRRNER